jgi:hypothetical protein
MCRLIQNYYGWLSFLGKLAWIDIILICEPRRKNVAYLCPATDYFLLGTAANRRVMDEWLELSIGG